MKTKRFLTQPQLQCTHGYKLATLYGVSNYSVACTCLPAVLCICTVYGHESNQHAGQRNVSLILTSHCRTVSVLSPSAYLHSHATFAFFAVAANARPSRFLPSPLAATETRSLAVADKPHVALCAIRHIAVNPLKNTPLPHMCYRAKFDSSWSNDMKIRRKFLRCTVMLATNQLSDTLEALRDALYKSTTTTTTTTTFQSTGLKRKSASRCICRQK